MGMAHDLFVTRLRHVEPLPCGTLRGGSVLRFNSYAFSRKMRDTVDYDSQIISFPYGDVLLENAYMNYEHSGSLAQYAENRPKYMDAKKVIGDDGKV